MITALVYPILPASAARVWQQLGLGSIEEAGKQAFLTDLGWGGLKAGTRFSDPAPLFPRAEKDAIERMQNLEDKNNASAVDAAAGKDSGGNKTAAPTQAPASTSVSPTNATDKQTNVENENLTQTTAVPHDTEQPVDTANVHSVPEELASARLNTTPHAAPAGPPLTPPTLPEEKKENPPDAPPQPAQITSD